MRGLTASPLGMQSVAIKYWNGLLHDREQFGVHTGMGCDTIANSPCPGDWYVTGPVGGGDGSGRGRLLAAGPPLTVPGHHGTRQRTCVTGAGRGAALRAELSRSSESRQVVPGSSHRKLTARWWRARFARCRPVIGGSMPVTGGTIEQTPLGETDRCTAVTAAGVTWWGRRTRQLSARSVHMFSYIPVPLPATDSGLI